MSLFSFEEHAANPPESWVVVKVAEGAWQLRTAADGTLEQFSTRRAAEGAKTSGFLVELYDQERRWYAGEQVRGWRPFAEVSS